MVIAILAILVWISLGFFTRKFKIRFFPHRLIGDEIEVSKKANGYYTYNEIFYNGFLVGSIVFAPILFLMTLVQSIWLIYDGTFLFKSSDIYNVLIFNHTVKKNRIKELRKNRRNANFATINFLKDKTLIKKLYD